MFAFRRMGVLAAVAVWMLGQAGTGAAAPKASAASATSPDGKVMASGNGNNILFIDVGTGKELRRLGGHQGRVTALAFSPDGKALASGSEDKTVRLWDIASGRLLAVMQGHTGAVTAVTYSPDGKSVITQGADKKTMTWDAATGKLIKKQ
jgi:WD40 repeat protein